jgi:hypothetical protein
MIEPARFTLNPVYCTGVATVTRLKPIRQQKMVKPLDPIPAKPVE